MDNLVAWAAGLFEGEGYISSKRTKGYAIALGLKMTDRDVVDRFGSVVGVGAVRGPYNNCNGVKPVYVWQTGKFVDVFSTLKLFWPYLGERRRVKTLESLTDYYMHKQSKSLKSPKEVLYREAIIRY